jgi:hypothetical protein
MRSGPTTHRLTLTPRQLRNARQRIDEGQGARAVADSLGVGVNHLHVLLRRHALDLLSRPVGTEAEHPE